MHILSNKLIRMPGDGIPLPWYHRAPLGLMSGAPCVAALQNPDKRPLGDLVISGIEVSQWQSITEVSASQPDGPGILASAFKLAHPLNIALAEAVTIDSGSRHDARLILEPFGFTHDHPEDALADHMEQHASRIKEGLAGYGFVGPTAETIHPPGTRFAWIDGGTIEDGLAYVDGWRDALLEQQEQGEAYDYDLDLAVVSADTHQRLLRFVFPRKGATSVSVKHKDQPGAMATIAEALASHDLNILSALLRRGTARRRDKAEFVAVVEPQIGAGAGVDAEERVHAALKNFAPEMEVRAKILKPNKPADVLYTKGANDIAVRPSPTMALLIQEFRKTIPSDRTPIFISRRFSNELGERGKQYVEEVYNVLRELGCEPVEASPSGGAETGVPDQVKAMMWECEAAIVLVISTPDANEFSINLAHELGFMQGQGKPLLPLVQEGVEKTVIGPANLQGLALATFSEQHACEPREPSSIHALLEKWLAFVRAENEGFPRAGA